MSEERLLPVSAERLRQYAAEVQHPAGEDERLSDYEIGYAEGLRKAAELLAEWEREEGT